MATLLQIYLDQFLIFALILSRISGLILTVPLFSSRSIPLRLRALLAVALSLLITPTFWGLPVYDPQNLLNLGILIGKEFLLGMTLGLGIMILFMGLQVAGQIVSQMSALSLAEVFDPAFDGNMSVFSQLFEVIALSCFLLIGGHRHVMGGLLETFQWMPPGDVTFSAGIVAALLEITTQTFLLGVRAAAPTIVALLLSILVLGLISRTLPQLNILAVGFSLNAVVLIGTLSLTLGSIVLLFQDHVEPTVEMVLQALSAGRET